jgi:minichromosome maintenance protein 10
VQYQKPAPSNLISKLSKLSGGTAKQEQVNSAQRSHSLLTRPKPEPSIVSNPKTIAVPPSASQSVSDIVPNRDDRLAIVEQLEVGPVDHKPPLDDPNFQRLEPNSGIRLSLVLSSQLKSIRSLNSMIVCRSRSLPHDDLQEYLRGRYYLSPSKLYSCIRLLPNQSGYDVPVEGDWITIAVVAERGPVRTTRAPVDIAPGDDGRATDDEGASGNTNNRKVGNDSRTQNPQKQKPSKSYGKKFVNMKLIDFGVQSRPSSSGAASIRGDAFLTLLLFEADSSDRVTSDDGKVKKLYSGGSKGAFEAMSKLKEGDVIALLNPKVLKPFQVSLHELYDPS